MNKKGKAKERFGIIIVLQCFLLVILFFYYRKSVYNLIYFPLITIATCVWGIHDEKNNLPL